MCADHSYPHSLLSPLPLSSIPLSPTSPSLTSLSFCFANYVTSEQEFHLYLFNQHPRYCLFCAIVLTLTSGTRLKINGESFSLVMIVSWTEYRVNRQMGLQYYEGYYLDCINCGGEDPP